MHTVQKFFGHLHTVNAHRRMVRKLCFQCGLYWQGLTHDLSKYSPTEFWNGVRFYTGKASPHIGERKEYGYSKAWLHHKGRNKHHGEYWNDIQPDGTTAPIVMPIKYLMEMICDRVAASKIYLKDQYTDAAPLEYYRSHKDENQFHETTREALETALEAIALDGLDKVFSMLKPYVRIACKRGFEK